MQINGIIHKLDNIINNIEIYYKIFDELTKAFYGMKYKKYESIINIIQFKKFNNIINEDIKKIINITNIEQKIGELMKIYEQMTEKNNHIIAEILIDQNNINSDIRIINSYEQRKREEKIECYKYRDEYQYTNEHQIKENCNITIDDVPIVFSYFYKFNKAGIHKIKYSFDNNVTKANDLFANCFFIKYLDFSKFNSEYVSNMCSMFYGCKRLENINLSFLNTEKVFNMSCMFSGCESLKVLDLLYFNTAEVINMSSFLSGCKSLNKIDLSNFDIKKVENLSWMFYGCSSLNYINLHNFNTEGIKYLYTMFNGLKIDNENLNIITSDRNILNIIIKFSGIKNNLASILLDYYAKFLSYKDCLENSINISLN